MRIFERGKGAGRRFICYLLINRYNISDQDPTLHDALT